MAVAVQTDYAMYGLMGKDGNELWTCEGPRPRAARGAVRLPSHMQLINKQGAVGTQRVLFQLPEDMAVCRPVSNAPPVEGRRSTAAMSRPVASMSALSKDPRLRVPLFHKSKYDKQEFATTLWGMIMSLFLIVLPAKYVRLLIAKRSWSLRTLLLLPVLCAAILLCMTMRVPDLVKEPFSMSSEWGRIRVAVICLPLITFPVLLISHARSKKWARFVTWNLVTIVLAIVFAVDSMLGDPRQLIPGERYTLQGWPFAWFIGTWAAGWLAVLQCTLLKTVRVIGNIFPSRRRWDAQTVG